MLAISHLDIDLCFICITFRQPDDRERLRSEELCSYYQRNRNPFVDFPDLAEYIFGTAAEARADDVCPACLAPEPDDDNEEPDEVQLQLQPCDFTVIGFNSRAGSEPNQPDSVRQSKMPCLPPFH